MNQQEMNIALCELRGWKNADHPDVRALKVGWVMPERWCMDPDGTLRFNHHRPDHFNGEAALHHCHEAEKMLTERQRELYARLLHPRGLLAVGHLLSDFHALHATAPRRAEALCRTLFPERFR